MVLLIAGTDTSSNAMTIGFFHLMANEGLKKKLQAELREAWPEKDTPFSYEMAEKLPYLVRSCYGLSYLIADCVVRRLPSSKRHCVSVLVCPCPFRAWSSLRLSLTGMRFLLVYVCFCLFEL